MNRAIPTTDRECRFTPGLIPKHRGQVIGAAHCENRKERLFPLPENDGTPANDAQAAFVRGSFHAAALFFGRDRKDAGEQPTPIQMSGSDTAVIGDIPPHLETAGDFLRMIAFNSGAEREVRRTSKDKIEPFVVGKDFRIAKITPPDLVPVQKAVVLSGLSRQLNALFLGFDRHKVRARQAPGRDHSDGSDAASQVEYFGRAWGPGGPVPCDQEIVGGKPVPVLELE